LDFIDIHKEFSKQGSAIKPLFDTNDVSGGSLSSLFLVTSFVPRHKITFPMCVLGVLILEVAKLIHCSTLSSVAPDTDALIVF
jgi:hypothetical protein